MIGLVDLTKFVVARIYPALVWGTLMGLAVHAGLGLPFFHYHHDSVESESITVVNDVAFHVPTTLRFSEATPTRSAALP
jgi:hypothetical protein